MVIRQYKAKGPVCEMLLPVVAMDDALGPDGLCHLHQRGAGHGQRRAHDRGQYGADPAGRDRRFAGAGHGHRLCAEPVHELLPLPGQQAGPDHCRHLSGAGPVRPVGAVQSALHHDDRRGHDQRLQDRERGHRADRPLHAAAVPAVLRHFRCAAEPERSAHRGACRRVLCAVPRSRQVAGRHARFPGWCMPIPTCRNIWASP